MNQNKWARVLAIVLAVMMMVSLAACAKTPASSVPAGASSAAATPSKDENKYYNETGYPICSTPITITMAGSNQSSYTPDWNNLLEIKKIEEKFGIKINGTMYNRDAWKNTLATLLTGDDMPDLLICADLGADAAKYGMQGQFLALNKYKDLMPNLFSLMDSHPDLKMALTAADGNVYGLNRYMDYKIVTARSAPLWINETWLKNVGMEAPKTADEMYKVLKAFKEQDANGNGDKTDEIPLGAMDNWSAVYLNKQMMAMFGMYALGRTKEGTNYNFYVDDNGKVGMYETTENYKAYLTFMQKLYTEGLMDSEFYTMTDAQFTERRNANVYGMVAYSGWAGSTTTANDVKCIAGLTSDYTSVRGATLTGGAVDPGKCVVNAETKYGEAICRLLDYFYTQENQDEFYEGVAWQWENSTVKGFENVKVRDQQAWAEKNGWERTKSWEFVTSKCLIQNGFQNFYVADTSIYAGLDRDKLIEVNKQLKADTENPGNCEMYVCFTDPDLKYFDAYPTLSYTAEELETRAQIMTTMTSFLDSQQAQIITGKTDIETGYKALVDGLKAQGLDELLKLEQTAYDRATK